MSSLFGHAALFAADVVTLGLPTAELVRLGQAGIEGNQKLLVTLERISFFEGSRAAHIFILMDGPGLRVSGRVWERVRASSTSRARPRARSPATSASRPICPSVPGVSAYLF